MDHVIDACIHVKDCHETNSGLDDYDEEDEEQKCDCEHEICYLKFVFIVVNLSMYIKKHQNCRALYLVTSCLSTSSTLHWTLAFVIEAKQKLHQF